MGVALAFRGCLSFAIRADWFGTGWLEKFFRCYCVCEAGGCRAFFCFDRDGFFWYSLRMANCIYITRHGESQWNVEKKVQGVTDTPLTQKGIEQARELARKIKEEKVHFSEVLHSPLSRAAETARVIAAENNLPLVMEPRLIEQNFGEYEGYEWAKRPGSFHEVKKMFACDYNGGESMLRLAQRVYNLIDELKERAAREDKIFLLVTHGGIVRMFHSYFFSETNDEFSSTEIGNCELRRYEF